jgi:nicotinamide riboside transporter PnuC
MRQFRTSSRFGVIGVFVVMALCATVALTMGQDQAKPKDAFALIFGIIAVYLVLLSSSRPATSRGPKRATHRRST